MKRRARWSFAVIVVLMALSLSAEFWANSKPLFMRYQGRYFSPVVITYHPSEFGQEGLVTDYRALDLKSDRDWALWTVVAWDPFEANGAVETYPSPPSRSNWLGTDDRGRDVLARLLYGLRYSLGFALLVWFFSFLGGTAFGALMGYCGGWIDLVGQRVVEMFNSLPYLLILLTLVALIGASFPLLVIFSVLFGWIPISGFMRAEFLRLRDREFVEAARAQGVGTGRILFSHILPNAMGPLISFSPAEIGSYIYTLVMLDYLGMGLPPPTPSWGELLQQAQNYFTQAWWLALYPSAALVVVLVALTFIGDGVRAAYDPRKV